MAFHGHIPEDIPESEPTCPDRGAPLDPDQLLAHLRRLGIDLEGFDQDPMALPPMALYEPTDAWRPRDYESKRLDA